ncbi:MAG: glycosyltransferase, partial [Candidatus Binatia bacterium]
ALGLDMAKIYAASKICLNNLTREPNRHGHLMRTFEIAACGGFQLSERSEETLTFFEEGKEIECYGSLEECREKIKYYLSHEAERRKIAVRGHQRCRASGYSYADRAKQVLSSFRDIS